MNLDTTDPTFVADLKASENSVNAIADHFREKGMSVWVPKTETRPTAAEARFYSDKGDLFVGWSWDALQEVEVKHRKKLTFTNAWPRDETFYLDSKRKIENKGWPGFYAIANGPLTHYAWLHVTAQVRDVVHLSKQKMWGKGERERLEYTLPPTHWQLLRFRGI